MSDRALRRLQRTWLESCSPEDAEKFDDVCRRAGILSDPRQDAYSRLATLLEHRSRTLVVPRNPDPNPLPGELAFHIGEGQVVAIVTCNGLYVHHRNYRVRTYAQRFEVTMTPEYFSQLLADDVVHLDVVTREGWHTPYGGDVLTL